MRRLALTALAPIALMLAPAAPAGVKDACSLVSAAEIAKALFVKHVAPGAHTAPGSSASCTYRAKPISVVIQTLSLTMAGYRNAVHALKAPAVQAGNVSANAWVSFAPNGISLIAWQRGTELTVRVLGAASNASLFAPTIAKIALGRLR